MDHDIRAIVDGSQQDWRGDGIVDDQWDTVAMGYASYGFDIADVSGGIGDGFAIHGASIFIDQFFDVAGAIGLGEANSDSLPGEVVSEQRVRGSVQLRKGDDIGSHLCEI